MHLSYSSSTYKGKTYKSYAIAKSYREGKTVRKRTIWSIGKLSDEQAEQIRMICKVASGKEAALIQLKDIVVKESKAYLDIALVDELWNHWQLDRHLVLMFQTARYPHRWLPKYSLLTGVPTRVHIIQFPNGRQRMRWPRCSEQTCVA